MRPAADVTDSFVGLGDLAHPQHGRVQAGCVDAALADQQVGIDAEALDDAVLQQAVHDDHVGAQQFLAAGDLLLNGGAVVRHELEIEVGDPGAGIAFARCRLADVAPPTAEGEIASFDRVEEHRPIDRLAQREGERGIALELGQPEIRPERGDHRADEVGQDVLSVLELHVGQVAGVAGDVGDQEGRRLGDGGHGSSRTSRRPGLVA